MEGLPAYMNDIIESASFVCTENGADKEYHIQLVKVHPLLHDVLTKYGRRGSTLQTGNKGLGLHWVQAKKAYDKECANRLSKGYRPEGASPAYTDANLLQTDIRPQLLNPVEDESQLQHLLQDPTWIMQWKMDGRNITIVKTDGNVAAINRKGQIVSCPMSVAECIKRVPGNLRIAGEMVGETYHAFDLVAMGGLEPSPVKVFLTRHRELVALSSTVGWQAEDSPVQVLNGWFSTADKRRVFKKVKESGGEGVVFKDAYAKFTSGRPSSYGPALKYKFTETATCFVVGKVAGKRSVHLAVVKGAGSTNVGKVTIPPNFEVPKPGSLVEVRYLYAFPNGGSLYQPVCLGVRYDKDEADDYSTLKFKVRDTEEDEA